MRLDRSRDTLSCGCSRARVGGAPRYKVRTRRREVGMTLRDALVEFLINVAAVIAAEIVVAILLG